MEVGGISMKTGENESEVGKVGKTETEASQIGKVEEFQVLPELVEVTRW